MSEERRVVTILFADVAGSTSLGEELDPEDVRALMARYYEAAQRAVADHGGTLEKFIGDAVMAVFGLPRAHGDDAERAAAAAVALRSEIQADRGLQGLQLRFGLATGEVVAARDVARGEFLVTGDAVNVAARLQQAAETWEILATDRTAFDAGARFAFGAPRELVLRGRTEPVLVRTLDAVKGGPARPSVTFVGREDELDQLRLTGRRCFRDGTPAVASIVAAAGTGKTRLVEQFVTTVLPELAPRARVETAQCLPYGRQMTYWPLRSVLFNLAGIPETAAPAEIQARVAGWLGPGRDAELLAATVGAESAESADPTELFAAWRAAFARAAAEAPLVLIFEDLHWSGDSLLDLVEFVMDPREHVPVLTIAVARPELLDRRPAWGGGRRNFVALYLDPLPESDIVGVVAPLLEGAPDELVREVVRRSEGNPFFAGELARAALEAGGVALPDTVHATVLARLDLLREGPRRALQVASVFGRSFRAEGLGALAPELTAGLPADLDELIGRDLLRRADAEHLAFRHILIRDVAYSTLPRAERARLHAAAGAWFEERAEGREDAVAEIVALHYREAASLRGPGEVRAKAVAWLRRAADAAVGAAATKEAEGHLRAALELAGEDDQAAELWSRLGDVLAILPGGYEAYLRAYELARAPRVRLEALIGLLMHGTRWLFASAFSADQMESACAEGERLIREVGDLELEGRFRAALSFRAHWAGRWRVRLSDEEVERTRNEGLRALEIAEQLDSPNLASAALDGLGSLEMVRGDWAAARSLAERRRRFGERLSSTELMDAEHMVSWCSIGLGDPRTALETSIAVAARLRAGQLPDWRLSTLVWQIRAQLVLGAWDEAVGVIRAALAQLQQLGPAGPAWIIMSFPLAVAAMRGRDELALAEQLAAAIRNAFPGEGATHLQRAVLAMLVDDLPRMLRAAGEDDDRGNRHLVEGDILAYAADRGLWEGLNEHWLEKLTGDPILPVRVQALRAAGLRRGDPEPLRSALELARRTSDVPAAARLSVELGRSSADEALLAAGRDALVRLGDQRQLERFGLAAS